MNTPLKPPCCNGEASAKIANTWLEHVAAQDEKAILTKNNREKFDSTNTGCTILSDRHSESPCYVYDNMRDFVRSKGYIVITDTDGSVNYPYAFKGYNYKDKTINQSEFSYLYIGEDREDEAYATLAYCQQKLTTALNYKEFMHRNAQHLADDINDDMLLDSGEEISLEAAENLVYAYRDIIFDSLTSYDPYNVDMHYYELMLAFTTAYNNNGVWQVEGVNDAIIDLENVTIKNGITYKVITGTELVDDIQLKFLDQSYEQSMDTAEAIIKHLMKNPNCTESLVQLMHHYKNN